MDEIQPVVEAPVVVAPVVEPVAPIPETTKQKFKEFLAAGERDLHEVIAWLEKHV